jgi:hypothetical protein
VKITNVIRMSWIAEIRACIKIVTMGEDDRLGRPALVAIPDVYALFDDIA